MTVKITVSLHPDRIRAVLRNPAGPPAQFVKGRCQLAVAYSKQDCPVDEGRLRASITYRVTVEEQRVVGTVYTPVSYARYVHEGTGIYGPRRQWIFPKNGSVMVFESKGAHGPLRRGKRRPAKGKRDLVFARKVRGIPPSPFLVSGLTKAMPEAVIRRY